MANFRIGDKARLVNVSNAPNPDWRGCEGDEVTILGLPGCDHEYPTAYAVTKPQHMPPGSTLFFCLSEYLSPLTDPGCERFIASLKNTDEFMRNIWRLVPNPCYVERK